MLTRAITAALLLLFVFIAVFSRIGQPYLICFLLLGVGYLAAREWAAMLPKPIHPPVYALLITALSALSLFISGAWLGLCLIGAVFWLFAVYWIKRYPKSTEHWFSPRLVVIGALTILSCTTAAYALWNLNPWWLIYAMALVWVTDTGAYLFGRKLGKTKLAPNVSPNKTYEGMVGGLFLSAVFAGAIGKWVLQLHGTVLISFFALSIVCAYVSVAGDLFESMIKREAGVKDSGKILPGHGGVLDRIDSQLATLPLFYVGGSFIMPLLFSVN